MRVGNREAEKWFVDAAWLIRGATKHAGWEPADEKIVVDLWVWWKDRRKRDVDNLNKAILDALVKNGVVTDDHLCLPRWQDYDFDNKNPRVEVTIWKKDGLPESRESMTSATAQR
jgi:crossover junction endodeoxyribonuclease RusA